MYNNFGELEIINRINLLSSISVIILYSIILYIYIRIRYIVIYNIRIIIYCYIMIYNIYYDNISGRGEQANTAGVHFPLIKHFQIIIDNLMRGQV